MDAPPPPPPPPVANSDLIETVKPFSGESTVEWIDYAVQQAVIAQNKVVETLESTINVTKSRIDQIKSTSTAHFHMTLESLRDMKSEYNAYEDFVFGKMKEGVYFTASHPFAASGLVIGSGILASKKTRRSLYYSTMRIFTNDEAMLAKANAKAQKLRDAVKTLTADSMKLEMWQLQPIYVRFRGSGSVWAVFNRVNQKDALDAEDKLKRGRTKLRQAGKQIRGVISSAYKIENQAGGLKDILKELPKRDASGFRSEVSQLGSQAKRERKVLSKQVKKISNYGISV